MHRLFPPFISFDDERCKQPIPHSLERINGAVLYLSGEIQKPPKKYPFTTKSTRSKIESILSNYILNRLLNRSDNNWVRNYLLGSIEYCLLSSSNIIIQNNDNDNKKQEEKSEKTIGLITNISFLNTFTNELLSQFKA
eukprot:35225_1